jgi:hypothetical protein
MPEIILAMSLVLGGVSAGESGLLLVGMQDASGPTAWMTPGNIAYSVSDIAAGIGLITLALVMREDERWLLIPAYILIATNGLRMAEYLMGKDAAFCANEALFAVDIGKLLVAIALSGMLTYKSIQGFHR